MEEKKNTDIFKNLSLNEELILEKHFIFEFYVSFGFLKTQSEETRVESVAVVLCCVVL